jgi:outer membrane receptor protein involved in Fe transport
VLDRLTLATQKRDNGEASVTWRRKFAGDDHELVASLSHELTDQGGHRQVTNIGRAPVLPEIFETFVSDNGFAQTELKADYTRPMPGEAKLKAGYQFQFDDNDYDTVGRRGPVAGALPVDPSLTNRFLYKQTLNAAYATYERPFGDLTVLAGLRLEDVRLDLNQVTDRVKVENDYFRAYPSLHLSYPFSENQQLNLSYSLRVQRPQPQDLNPFRSYQDPLNYRAGNPNLKPQETHSFEAAYQYRHSGTFYLATLYYRQSYDGVTDVVRDLGGGVILTTKENLSESRAGGLELVANGRLSPKLTYNVSGNLFWNEIDASELGFTDTRSGFALSGRANLNWQVTAKDFIQLNGFMNGDRLTPQGHAKGFGTLNLGYRRKFNESLSAVVTVQDVLKSFRDGQVIDTPTLKDHIERDFNVQGVYVGLTWTFGGQRQRDPAFDFGGGGGGGGGGAPQ